MHFSILRKLEFLDSLIRTKATGSPKQLAAKLEIGERAVYYYIDLLKSLDAPLKFDKGRNSYIYTENGEFHFRFKKTKQQGVPA
jgi:hypothetical protein